MAANPTALAIRIGLDVTGGDAAPQTPLQGAVLAKTAIGSQAELVLVGPTDLVQTGLAEMGQDPAQWHHLPAEVPTQDASATRLIATQPNHPMNVGTRALKAGELDAFVSAGNTGALVVAGVINVGMIPGLDRPAVGAHFPNTGGRALLLDVGANVDCKPEQLLQFARIGRTYLQAVHGMANPRVALVNIGEEPGKGNHQAQEAYQLLAAEPALNFVGNAEGRDLTRNTADVYVCDGFMGNVLLKYAESIYDVLRDKVNPDDAFIRAMDYEAIGGLPVLGLQGTVILGHGSSRPQAIAHMLQRALESHQSQLPQALAKALAP